MNEVPEIISKFLERVSNLSDLVDDTDVSVSSITKEVEQNLRANRKRKNLNCEFTRNDSCVGIRFPGKNYNEYRARQLKELTEILRSQRSLMQSEPRKTIESRNENWRKKDSTSNTADDVNLSKIYNSVRNQSCSTTKNWRTACKTLVPTKNKENEKYEDDCNISFPAMLEFNK